MEVFWIFFMSFSSHFPQKSVYACKILYIYPCPRLINDALVIGLRPKLFVFSRVGLLKDVQAEDLGFYVFFCDFCLHFRKLDIFNMFLLIYNTSNKTSSLSIISISVSRAIKLTLIAAPWPLLSSLILPSANSTSYFLIGRIQVGTRLLIYLPTHSGPDYIFNLAILE